MKNNTNINNTTKMQTYCVRTCKAICQNNYSDHTHWSIDVNVHSFIDVESALNITGASYAEYVVKSLDGEIVLSSAEAFQQWKESVTMDNIAQYQILIDQYSRVVEYSFSVQQMEKITSKAPGKIIGLDVYDKDNDELLAHETFACTDDAFDYADDNFIKWKYADCTIRNIAIIVQGVDVSMHYDSRYRNNCNIYREKRYATHFSVRIDDYIEHENDSEEGDSFVCCICGNTHSAKDGVFNPAPVRPANNPDGSRNCCCIRCYESYVGSLYAFMFALPIFQCHDEKYAKYPSTQDEYIDMLRRSSAVELDAVIKEADIGRLAMSGLRFLEANRAEAEKRRIKEEERKARAKERARERRAAAKAVKLANEENN